MFIAPFTRWLFVKSLGTEQLHYNSVPNNCQALFAKFRIKNSELRPSAANDMISPSITREERRMIRRAVREIATDAAVEPISRKSSKAKDRAIAEMCLK